MRSYILAGASALALSAMPSFAQEAKPAATAATPAPTATAAADAEDEGIILVTGSRIARTGFDAPVPVTALTAAELTANGNVSIGDTLNQLPAFRSTFSTQNSGRFIGTAGLNILDLRGLGTGRTLVLVNGRRHVTAQPGSNSVDVNTIPTDLIKRVDVVTGGNSAVYGSDAVAGVVNFILDDEFDGLRLRGQSGISSKGDRPTQLVTLTAGKNFSDNRGNIAINLEYSNLDQLRNLDRPDLSGAFAGRNQFNATENVLTEPSTGNGIPDTTFLRGVRNIGFSDGGAFTATCPAATATNAAVRALNCTGLRSNTNAELGRVFVFLPDGSLVANDRDTDLRPFGSGNSVGANGLGSTQRNYGQLQPGVTRYAANLLAHYDVSDAFRPFIEAKYVRVDSLQASSPSFTGGTLSGSVNINNPFLAPAARATLVQALGTATNFTLSRNNVDFGARGEEHTRETFRGVVGVRGDFLDTWRYEAAFSYGRTDTFYTTEGNVNLANYGRALNAVRNTAGQIVCAVNADAITTNDDPACRPLNLFGQGNVSPEALNYVIAQSSREQWAEQYNAIAYVSGDSSRWFDLPGGPIGFSVGGEWRREKDFSAFDEFTRSGATFLNSSGIFAPVPQRVLEGFGEIRLPILKDVPFFQELTVEASGRVSDYSVGQAGTTFAWNAGAIWSPVEGLRFRGGYAQAVRAPTQTNLFGALNQTFLNGLVDPCSQNRIRDNPNRVANCAAGGVPTTQTFLGSTEPFTNVPTSGIAGFNGSNPLLNEERSTSITAGMVAQPKFIPGLLLAVDYWNIDVKNVIQSLLPQTIINQCYDAPGGIDNQFCKSITRNPNGTFAGQSGVNHAGTQVFFPQTGSSFTSGPFNFARLKTSGIDVDVNYQMPSSGDFRFGARLIASYLINRDNFTDINIPTFINQQKLELGDPEWQGQLRLNASYKTFDFSWAARLVGKTTIATEYETQNSVQGRPPTNPDAFPQVFYPTVTYHDIRAQLNLGKNNIYLGVDNLFDQQPPFQLLGTEDGAGVYSNVGRFYYVGTTINF
jgi:outer membrane receptor protein involved in Fe transport